MGDLNNVHEQQRANQRFPTLGHGQRSILMSRASHGVLIGRTSCSGLQYLSLKSEGKNFPLRGVCQGPANAHKNERPFRTALEPLAMKPFEC